MKLCVDNDWLRRQIESDPIGEVEAGRGFQTISKNTLRPRLLKALLSRTFRRRYT